MNLYGSYQVDEPEKLDPCRFVLENGRMLSRLKGVTERDMPVSFRDWSGLPVHVSRNNGIVALDFNWAALHKWFNRLCRDRNPFVALMYCWSIVFRGLRCWTLHNYCVEMSDLIGPKSLCRHHLDEAFEVYSLAYVKFEWTKREALLQSDMAFVTGCLYKIVVFRAQNNIAIDWSDIADVLFMTRRKDADSLGWRSDV